MENASGTRPRQTVPAGARVVVVGAGFAGGTFLRNLPTPLRRPGETLLVDKGEEYAFIPLIHEVAVGRVHPDSIRFPLAPDGPAASATPYRLLQTEATGVDLDHGKLITSIGEVGYEYLILAPGSVANYPPPNLAQHFQTFWTLEDALALRASLNAAWRTAVGGEKAEAGGLTVAIVGGGATGVELAAEVAALFGYLRKRAARRPVEEPRVVLFEASDRLMGWLEPYFHEVAVEELGRLGVEVRLGTEVTAADEGGVEAAGERLPARTRVWTAGGRANPLVAQLPGAHDAAGRARVTERLTLPDHPNVYVLGDCGVYEHPHLGDLPPTASVAVQQGPYAARDVGRRLRGVPEEQRGPFDFFDRGYIVSLGPESGVGIAVGARLRGPAAQALYRGVFLYYMKSRRGRFLTGVDWAMERTLGRVGFGSGQPSAVGRRQTAGS